MGWLTDRRRRRAEEIARGRLELFHRSYGNGWEIRYWPHGKPCDRCGYVIAWSNKVPPERYWQRILEREIERVLNYGRTTYYVHSAEAKRMPWPVEYTPEDILAAKQSIHEAAEKARNA